VTTQTKREFITDDNLYSELRSELAINRRKVVDQQEQSAVLYDLVGSMVAKLWDQTDYYDIELDLLESRTAIRIRKELEEQGQKITEDKVKLLLQGDAECISMRHTKREAKTEHQKWSILLQAYDKRAYALQSIAASVQSNLTQYGRT
jgi:hypothetical protein